MGKKIEGISGGDLVAVAMAPGPAWLTVLESAWAAGAAVLPVDNRLPAPERARLLDLGRPSILVEAGDLAPVRLTASRPVDLSIALVMPTSGTRGRPRLAEISHKALASAIGASAARLGASPRDGWLCSLPLAHMGGMLVLARALLAGAPVELRPRFDTADYAAGAGRYAAVVPTMLVRLLERGIDLSAFSALLVGGAAIDPVLADRLTAAGANLVPTYGLTESCGGVVYGGYPLDGVALRVERGGQILLRGPMLMRGYRLDPDATAAALNAAGWLRTGDVGVMRHGRLVVWGRSAEVIVTGGEKVWPDEVEAALRQLEGIVDVGVVGAPDPEWGQRVVACVVMDGAAPPPVLDQVQRKLAASLAAHKLPRQVVPLAALPRTASGKLRRVELARAVARTRA